jgi:hypothetical protein
MKISIGKGSFTAEANMSNVENIVLKTIPERIKSYFNCKKDIRKIELSIKYLRKECFGILPKKCKYKKYVLPVPRTIEQFKQDLELCKYVEENIFDDYLEKKLEGDTIEHTMLKRFYDENGGFENFICFYQKGIKLSIYSLQPFKKVYTHSKKNKAVFIIEQFRKSDNSYCLFGYCTKNFEPKKL